MKNAETVVRARIPLAGLERVATAFNDFSADPLQGGALDDVAPDARMMYWLRRFAGIGPDDFVAGFPEAVQKLLRQFVGNDAVELLRPCAWCGRWIVARHRNRLRCGPKCHTKEWSRARRREVAAARLRANVPANVPASTRKRPTSTPRQPTRQRKTPR